MPHHFSKQQNKENVRIDKETLKLLNNGGTRIISEILTPVTMKSN